MPARSPTAALLSRVLVLLAVPSFGAAACDDGPDAPARSNGNRLGSAGWNGTAGAGGTNAAGAGSGGVAGDTTEPLPALAQVGERCDSDGRRCVPTAYCAYKESCAGEGRCWEKPPGCLTLCDPEHPEGFCACDGNVYCARCEVASKGISLASDPSFCQRP